MNNEVVNILIMKKICLKYLKRDFELCICIDVIENNTFLVFLYLVIGKMKLNEIIKNKLTGIFLFLLIGSFSLHASESIIDFQISNATISINTTKGKYEIQYFSNNVIQTAFLNSDEDEIGDSHGIIGHEASFGLKVDQIQMGVYGFYPDINKNPPCSYC